MVGPGRVTPPGGGRGVIPGRTQGAKEEGGGWDGTVEMEEVRAFLRLKAIPRLGDKGIWQLVRVHGSASAALRQTGMVGDLWSASSGETDLDRWRDSGIFLCPLTSPHYPRRLLELADPPPLLSFRGRSSLLHPWGVAVVGSRKATESGRRTARALGRVLGRARIPVLSGLALGIDGAAHQGALEAEGDTVAVLGSGLDVAYPPSHRRLRDEIREKGLLLSEFLPSEPALPHHFPRRNRILAALSRAVVVVEAGARSGALITVDHGLDLGRDILAFPGSVESPQAAGTNALIRDGARLLTHPEAILEELGDFLGEPAPPHGEAGRTEGPPADLPPELHPLWDSLTSEPKLLDPLAREAGLAPETALAGLSTLELLGWARRCPGMRFRRG